jgi:hypothetical protein
LGIVEATVGDVLLWFLANDASGNAMRSDIDKPRYDTYKAGQAGIEEQFEYYESIDSAITRGLFSFIQDYLIPYHKYFIESFHRADYRFINAEGIAKLKEEWPNIWSELNLEQYL